MNWLNMPFLQTVILAFTAFTVWHYTRATKEMLHQMKLQAEDRRKAISPKISYLGFALGDSEEEVTAIYLINEGIKVTNIDIYVVQKQPYYVYATMQKDEWNHLERIKYEVECDRKAELDFEVSFTNKDGYRESLILTVSPFYGANIPLFEKYQKSLL